MNDKDYFEQYKEQTAGFFHGCFGMFLVMVLFAAIIFLASCSTTEYVPVETVRTEKVEVHDTVTVADSTARNDSTDTKTRILLQKVDSAYLALLGIINAPKEAWLLQTEKNTTHKTSETSSHKQSEKNLSDSVRTVYKDRPYPVERELSRWEHFCLDYGKVMAGGSVVCVILIMVYLVRRIRKRKR